MSKPIVHVAVALLFHHSKVLVGWREAKQHQGNKYEFPGGKVEGNETPEETCRREIYEEVGVGLSDWHPFSLICHEYDDITVHLHLFFAHVPEEMLNQIQKPWAWYTREQLQTLDFPDANQPVIERLYWPHSIRIGTELSAIEQLAQDMLFYWRPEQAEIDKNWLLEYSIQQLNKLIVPYQVWRSLNVEQQHHIAAVHLKQSEQMSLKKGELCIGIRYIAACHDAASVQHAVQIGCEAVLISPVQATPTHPEAPALGWDAFAELAHQADVPVFALGGLSREDLECARQYGAYGIAGIRHI